MCSVAAKVLGGGCGYNTARLGGRNHLAPVDLHLVVVPLLVLVRQLVVFLHEEYNRSKALVS